MPYITLTIDIPFYVLYAGDLLYLSSQLFYALKYSLFQTLPWLRKAYPKLIDGLIIIYRIFRTILCSAQHNVNQ